MALSIKDDATDRLARQLADLTGETLTEAVGKALKERLQREKRRRGREGMADNLMRIGRRCAALPTRDDRSPDEILYDDRGLPK